MTRHFYEGQSVAGKTTHTEHEYDGVGNVVRFIDVGDVAANDDIEAIISYATCTDSYILNEANSIVVMANGQLQRRRESTVDCTTGNVTQVRAYVDNGQAAGQVKGSEHLKIQ